LRARSSDFVPVTADGGAEGGSEGKVELEGGIEGRGQGSKRGSEGESEGREGGVDKRTPPQLTGWKHGIEPGMGANKGRMYAILEWVGDLPWGEWVFMKGIDDWSDAYHT
jgi:hypothetical protein